MQPVGLVYALVPTNVIELHGNIMRTKCSDVNTVVSSWKDMGDIPPKCPTCGGLLRPDVVWFEEPMPEEEMQEAMTASTHCDFFFSIGTSTVVYPAAALPSLARQTGQPCATCHTAFPQLTPYGRRFKLMGYTTTGGQYAFPPYPPVALMLQSGFTHTNADLGPQGDAFNSSNNWTDLAQQASVFWGGKVTDHLGAFVQSTLSYDAGGTVFVPRHGSNPHK